MAGGNARTVNGIHLLLSLVTVIFGYSNGFANALDYCTRVVQRRVASGPFQLSSLFLLDRCCVYNTLKLQSPLENSAMAIIGLGSVVAEQLPWSTGLRVAAVASGMWRFNALEQLHR